MIIDSNIHHPHTFYKGTVTITGSRPELEFLCRKLNEAANAVDISDDIRELVSELQLTIRIIREYELLDKH